MEPLKFKHGPFKVVLYYFNDAEEYNGNKYVSIVKVIRCNYPADYKGHDNYNGSSTLTISESQLAAFSVWINKIVESEKSEPRPLVIPSVNGSVEFIFNRHEKYERKMFTGFHKKDTRSGKPKYQNLLVPKDEWSVFRKWLKGITIRGVKNEEPEEPKESKSEIEESITD